jgi:hypothetical protein
MTKKKRESAAKMRARLGFSPGPEHEKAEQSVFERAVHPLEAWLPVGGYKGPKFDDPPDDPISPRHYQAGGIEAIDVIEAFGLNYRLGNVVKYILRAGQKGPRAEDLRKAAWYLEREIARTS